MNMNYAMNSICLWGLDFSSLYLFIIYYQKLKLKGYVY